MKITAAEPQLFFPAEIQYVQKLQNNLAVEIKLKFRLILSRHYLASFFCWQSLGNWNLMIDFLDFCVKIYVLW